MQSLWRLSSVSLTGRERPRLDKLSLEIPAGVTAILGHSGAGKTSLLNLLVGFERPTMGTVETHFAAPEGRLSLYWVPSDLGLWPHVTVGQHLTAVAAGDWSRHSDSFRKLLAAFDLSDKIDARPDQLSQGERARLAVARACAADPAVLVLDEPLVHVDPAQAARYWESLRAYQQNSASTSVVFSTHAPEVVLREAEHVICLEEGHVVYSGAVSDLYYRPPSAAAAWALGPANWLSPEESTIWLRETVGAARCVRPEQLAATPVSDGPLLVEGTRFCGSIAELDLRDERTGRARRFFHRPAREALRAGNRVALQVLSLLLLCVCLAGCGGAAAHEPDLAAREVKIWSMPAEEARVPTPRAIHWTADHELYVLDNAGRVLVFNEDGVIVRKWWMPEYSVGKPERIWLLRDGRLAVADTHYHRIVFFDKNGRDLGHLGSFGRGPGEFVYPITVVDDDEGNLYVGEYGGNDRIQKFDRAGKFLLEFGTFGTEPGQLQRPSGLLWHEGRVFIADAFNNRLQVFSDSGEFLEVLTSSEKGTPLQYPYDLALSKSGDLFVVEYTAGRVSRFDLTGRLLGRFGSTGAESGQFSTPWALTVDDQSRVYVGDTENRRIVRLKF